MNRLSATDETGMRQRTFDERGKVLDVEGSMRPTAQCIADDLVDPRPLMGGKLSTRYPGWRVCCMVR